MSTNSIDDGEIVYLMLKRVMDAARVLTHAKPELVENAATIHPVPSPKTDRKVTDGSSAIRTRREK